jgi:hypothetical protein
MVRRIVDDVAIIALNSEETDTFQTEKNMILRTIFKTEMSNNRE